MIQDFKSAISWSYISAVTHYSRWNCPHVHFSLFTYLWDPFFVSWHILQSYHTSFLYFSACPLLSLAPCLLYFNQCQQGVYLWLEALKSALCEVQLMGLLCDYWKLIWKSAVYWWRLKEVSQMLFSGTWSCAEYYISRKAIICRCMDYFSWFINPVGFALTILTVCSLYL